MCYSVRILPDFRPFIPISTVNSLYSFGVARLGASRESAVIRQGMGVCMERRFPVRNRGGRKEIPARKKSSILASKSTMSVCNPIYKKKPDS